jgi:hypothetical protein
LQIHFVIEDPVMIGVRPMSWIILRKAVSKEEAGLKADRKGNVVCNVLMSANGQAYARTRYRLLNKLRGDEI